MNTNEKGKENAELDIEAIGLLNDFLHEDINHLDIIDEEEESDEDDYEFSIFNTDTDYLYLPATVPDDNEEIKDDFYQRNLLTENPGLSELTKSFSNYRENRFDVMVQEFSRSLKSRFDIDYIEDVEALMEAEIEEAVNDLRAHFPKIDQFVLKLRQLVLKEMLLAF